MSGLPRKHDPFRSRYMVVLISVTVGITSAAYFFSPWKSRGHQKFKLNPLSPSHFVPITLTSSVQSGPDTKLLTFSIPPYLVPLRGTSTFAPVWSVYIKNDDIQVERPYTPLEGIDESNHMKFWVKEYPNGEVGRWLHSKSVGDSIEIRGPSRTWEWKEGMWDEIVMISGGTGITPFYQLFHTVISSGTSPWTTRFTLLHSSRTPSELPPAPLLRNLATFAREVPERFRVHLFVDSGNGSPSLNHPLPIHVRRINKTDIQRYGLDHAEPLWWQKLLGWSGSGSKRNRRVLFLVCGPDQMVNTIAGPIGRNFSQGVVGGILGEMGYSSYQVHKLL